MIATSEKDYVGKIYGQLTIIRKVESKVREAKWLCLCSCGGNSIVAMSKLKRGQNCCTECSRRNRNKPANFIDLTGLKFGKLTVIKQAPIKKNCNARWECLCDCGNILTVVGTELRHQRYCVKCRPGGANCKKTYNDKEKYCSRCKGWKPLEAFAKRKNRVSGRDSYCYECSKNYRRTWLRKSFYGISDEEFNKAIEEHNERCAICDRHDKLVIDHCHKTGKFRGLICSLCNSMLGRFKDDIQLLNRAITYLNKHQNESVQRSA